MDETVQLPVVTSDHVYQALKQVYDPEIPVNLVDLGLVYEVHVDAAAGRVGMKMTLTAPGCGMGTMIAGNAEKAIRAVPGVKDVTVELVWEPRWTPERMSPDAKQKLGFA